MDKKVFECTLDGFVDLTGYDDLLSSLRMICSMSETKFSLHEQVFIAEIKREVDQRSIERTEQNEIHLICNLLSDTPDWALKFLGTPQPDKYQVVARPIVSAECSKNGVEFLTGIGTSFRYEYIRKGVFFYVDGILIRISQYFQLQKQGDVASVSDKCIGESGYSVELSRVGPDIKESEESLMRAADLLQLVVQLSKAHPLTTLKPPAAPAPPAANKQTAAPGAKP